MNCILFRKTRLNSMRKLILILTIILSSCYSSQEIISKTHKLNEDITFELKEYEEYTNDSGYIRNEDAIYVQIKLILNNSSAKKQTVDFKNFYLINEKNVKIPLWKAQYKIESMHTEKTIAVVEPYSKESVYLKFVAPKNTKNTHLVTETETIKLELGKTKSKVF